MEAGQGGGQQHRRLHSGKSSRKQTPCIDPTGKLIRNTQTIHKRLITQKYFTRPSHLVGTVHQHTGTVSKTSFSSGSLSMHEHRTQSPNELVKRGPGPGSCCENTRRLLPTAGFLKTLVSVYPCGPDTQSVL